MLLLYIFSFLIPWHHTTEDPIYHKKWLRDPRPKHLLAEAKLFFCARNMKSMNS